MQARGKGYGTSSAVVYQLCWPVCWLSSTLHQPNIFCIHSLQIFLFYTQGLFNRSFWLKMTISFWGPCSSWKASYLDDIKDHCFLNWKKSPFASPGRGFNPSLRKKGISGISSKKSFSTIFLIRKKSHRFSKTPEGDLIIPSKRRIKSWLQWDLNWSGKKRW